MHNSQLNVQHWCCLHQWQLEKISNQKNFKYFVLTLLGSRVFIKIQFFFQFTLRRSILILLPLFATGVYDNSAKFITVVPATPAVGQIFWWIGDLPPMSMTPVANLPLVSTTPEVPSSGCLPALWLISLLYLLSCCCRCFCYFLMFLLLLGSCCCWCPFSPGVFATV